MKELSGYHSTDPEITPSPINPKSAATDRFGDKMNGHEQTSPPRAEAKHRADPRAAQFEEAKPLRDEPLNIQAPAGFPASSTQRQGPCRCIWPHYRLVWVTGAALETGMQGLTFSVAGMRKTDILVARSKTVDLGSSIFLNSFWLQWAWALYPDKQFCCSKKAPGPALCSEVEPLGPGT